MMNPGNRWSISPADHLEHGLNSLADKHWPISPTTHGSGTDPVEDDPVPAPEPPEPEEPNGADPYSSGGLYTPGFPEPGPDGPVNPYLTSWVPPPREDGAPSLTDSVLAELNPQG